jgi:ABC-type sugar transport system ATPase subunit
MQGQQQQNTALLQSAQAVTDALRNHQELLAKESSAMQAQQRQLGADLIYMKSQVRSPAALLTHISMLKKDLSEQLDDQVELYEAQQKFHKLKAKLGSISMVGLTASEEDLMARQRGLNESIKKNREELAEAERDLLGVRDAQLHIDAEKTKLDNLKTQHDKHLEGMEWWDAMTRLVAGGPQCNWDITDLVKISQTFITYMEPRLSDESSESS